MGGSGNRHKIKGGGRAVLGRESREALVDLLIRLSEAKGESGETGEKISEHERKRREKKFVKRLVEEHERNRWKRKLRVGDAASAAADADAHADAHADAPNKTPGKESAEGGGEGSRKPVLPPPAASKVSSSSKNGNSGGKVRIELVEAIFREVAPVPAKKGKKDKKDQKSGGGGKKDDKKKKGGSCASDFKEGARKVVVLPRSTTPSELLKLAPSKLRMKKKPVRVFWRASKTALVDLGETGADLSGLDDGAVLCVTTTPQPEGPGKAAEKAYASAKGAETGEAAGESVPAETVDPLASVKRAYRQQAEHRRRARRHGQQQQKQQQQNQQQNQKQKQQQHTFPAAQPLQKAIVDESLRVRHAVVRADLPAASHRESILSSVRGNAVVVLCGATGCGKSTQVPQFLLEDQEALERDRSSGGESQSQSQFPPPRRYVVVTQPRRVAAISLANRVAEERGSPPPGEPGSSVGYLVRSDRRIDERTCRIVYVTVGILLRMLVSGSGSSKTTSGSGPQGGDGKESTGSLGPSLDLSIDNISHLVVDEVHERDVNTDFALTLLKGLMLPPPKSKARLPHLRLVLMSATASSDLFVNFFKARGTRPPEVIEIPGRTFPVDIRWLPECQNFAGTTMWHPGSGSRDEKTQKSSTRGGSGGDGPLLSPRARDKIDDKFVRALIAKIVLQQQAGGELRDSPDSGRNSFRKTGAILVFLPGRGEIESLASCLYDNSTIVGDREVCTILKLHSAVPRGEQEKVFRPARGGTVKIVLATNIAETSVTIPDVSHVIDTCRVKESRYNASARIRELVTVWTSRASLKQRAGRAGRTSAGVCWRLCGEDFCQKELLPQTAPEMLRTPLDELVLQICLLYEQRRDDFYGSGAAAGGKRSFARGAQPIRFLSMTPAPPPRHSLVQACRHLLEVDALGVVDGSGEATGGREDEWTYRLTPLGYHLSRLPMDAKVGKVLIVGCILGCLDGALTIAAALSCTRSCFLPATGPQAKSLAVALTARESLVENGFGGANWPGGTVKGDLIAVIATYRAWKKHRSDQKRRSFCYQHALDHATLRDMDRLRGQFRELLADAGFVAGSSSRGASGEEQEENRSNAASEDALLTSCCLVAGLYPNVCSLMRPRRGGPRGGGRLLTNDGDECRPQSSSFQQRRVRQASETGRDAYAVYHSKHRSIGTSSGTAKERPPEVFLTEVNFVSRFALLLFGGDLEIAGNAIVVDGWLKFKVGDEKEEGKASSKSGRDTTDNAVLLLALREKLDRMVLEHVVSESGACGPDERAAMEERHRSVVAVVRKLLAEEG
ncbi:unnamed protein product [Pseudo-nitzschia multistriata]|uniref:RNA helicase n=1 Tax=Pseudo-nitzschia multistriata TaxID=183589 RepID=A0A448YZR4_9STRA|nr:unnamed protein product [Pseudo-nitzschia multistriata]